MERRRGAATPTPRRDPSSTRWSSYNLYSVDPEPGRRLGLGRRSDYPGYLVRVDRGNNPPETCMTEVFKVPEPGFDPRGVDIDSNGVVWTALAASSHLASFDARKCKASERRRAKIDGSAVRGRLDALQTTGPKFKGTDIPADFHYYNWVDQHNIAGLRRRTRRSPRGRTPTRCSCSNPQTGEWTTLRVPYPLGFYSRGLDGRIDDPEAGWKGRGLWANYGTHFVWHIEGGKGTKGKVVKFQIRPDPLAH